MMRSPVWYNPHAAAGHLPAPFLGNAIAAQVTPGNTGPASAGFFNLNAEEHHG